MFPFTQLLTSLKSRQARHHPTISMMSARSGSLDCFIAANNPFHMVLLRFQHVLRSDGPVF